MMPTLLLMRIASVGVVATLALIGLERDAWLSLLYSLGLAHFGLSFVYARSRITALSVHPRSALTVLAIGAVGVALYFDHFPLVILFAMHHAFNEAYLPRSGLEPGSANESRLKGSASLLHLCLYLALLRDAQYLRSIDASLLLAPLLVAWAIHAYWLVRLRGSLGRRGLVEHLGFELLVLGLVGASFFIEIGFLDVVLYHFVLWSLVPLPGLARRGSDHAVARYLAANAGLTVGFLALSPAGPLDYPMAGSLMLSQFLFWSYVHFTTSVALSRAHPTWLTRLFETPAAART